MTAQLVRVTQLSTPTRRPAPKGKFLWSCAAVAIAAAGKADEAQAQVAGLQPGGCGQDPGPEGPIAGPESIVGPVGLMDSPMSEAAGLGGPTDSEGEEDEEESEEEESAESIAASLGLISTGGLTTQQLIDDPVTSASDSGQWGGDIDISPGE